MGSVAIVGNPFQQHIRDQNVYISENALHRKICSCIPIIGCFVASSNIKSLNEKIQLATDADFKAKLISIKGHYNTAMNIGYVLTITLVAVTALSATTIKITTITLYSVVNFSLKTTIFYFSYTTLINDSLEGKSIYETGIKVASATSVLLTQLVVLS